MVSPISFGKICVFVLNTFFFFFCFGVILLKKWPGFDPFLSLPSAPRGILNRVTIVLNDSWGQKCFSTVTAVQGNFVFGKLCVGKEWASQFTLQ